MRTQRTTPDKILAAALSQAGLRRTQQAYLRLLLTLWLALPGGRHNFTNLARYGPTSDRTHRSWARKQVPWVQLNSTLVLRLQDQQTLHRGGILYGVELMTRGQAAGSQWKLVKFETRACCCISQTHR